MHQQPTHTNISTPISNTRMYTDDELQLLNNHYYDLLCRNLTNYNTFYHQYFEDSNIYSKEIFFRNVVLIEYNRRVDKETMKLILNYVWFNMCSKPVDQEFIEQLCESVLFTGHIDEDGANNLIDNIYDDKINFNEFSFMIHRNKLPDYSVNNHKARTKLYYTASFIHNVDIMKNILLDIVYIGINKMNENTVKQDGLSLIDYFYNVLLNKVVHGDIEANLNKSLEDPSNYILASNIDSITYESIVDIVDIILNENNYGNEISEQIIDYLYDGGSLEMYMYTYKNEIYNEAYQILSRRCTSEYLTEMPNLNIKLNIEKIRNLYENLGYPNKLEEADKELENFLEKIFDFYVEYLKYLKYAMR